MTVNVPGRAELFSNRERGHTVWCLSRKFKLERFVILQKEKYFSIF